jgi:hypothetical protein
MPEVDLSSNPFALMMDPQAVLLAVEKSERLQRLKSRICRPLDKPMLPAGEGEGADAAADEAGETITADLDAAGDLPA